MRCISVSLSVTFFSCLHLLALGSAHRYHLCRFTSRGWNKTHKLQLAQVSMGPTALQKEISHAGALSGTCSRHICRRWEHIQLLFFGCDFRVVTKYCCSIWKVQQPLHLMTTRLSWGHLYQCQLTNNHPDLFLPRKEQYGAYSIDQMDHIENIFVYVSLNQ